MSWKIIEEHKINVLSNINEIVKVITQYETVHISFDVDALDPNIMQSTGTQSEGGIPEDEIIDLFNKLASFYDVKTINLDICEYNPLIGTSEEKEKSKDVIFNILLSLVYGI